MAEKIVKKVEIEVTDKGTLKRTSKDSQTLNRNMKGLSKQSSNASKNFSKTAQGMQGVLVPAYAEIAARVFALSAAYNALSRAADFRILMQGQEEYAKRTGKNMGEIARSVQKAAKGMLGFQEASSAVALATTSGISSAQIVEMTKRAVDSSTALGRSVQDTMDRLTRGIVKAEPEILDEIGVIIRLDKVYKDYAESVSKSTANLSEGEKATARYNAIMGQLEAKFGGIADKVDPNYMRAAAASTLDVIAQSSTKLIGLINPIFKFLSETKAAIVVILLVIVKTLAGKVFPMFDGFGKKITRMPQLMKGHVMNLQLSIDGLNAKMRESALIAKNVSDSIAKNIPKSMQMMGTGRKSTEAQRMAKFAAADEKTQIRSLRSKVGWARGHMEGGVVTSGSMVGMTAAEVDEVDKRVRVLAKDLGNTHSINQRLWNKGKVAAMGFRQTLYSIRQGFFETAEAASLHFNATKQLIIDNGLLMGTWLGLQAVKTKWLEAAGAAGIYNRVIRVTTAITGTLGVIAAFAAKNINRMFAIVMWLTLIISIGKTLISLFVDFDTPFKRASDAVNELNDKLKKQKTLLGQKDKMISFEGAASSFDEAMANATFMDNFATSLYESTSEVMKVLNEDMEKLGFWQNFFDSMKDIFGFGALDKMRDSVTYQTEMLTETSPHIVKAVMDRLVGDSNVMRDRTTDEIKQGKRGYLNDPASLAWRGAQGEKIFRGEGELRSTSLGIAMRDDPAAQKYQGQVKMSMLEWIDQQVRDLEGDDIEKRALYNRLHKEYNKELEKESKLYRERVADLKSMTDVFDNLGKAEKKFTDKLLIKTPVHQMAVEQANLIKLFKSDSTTGATKALALEREGILPDTQSTDYRALKDIKKQMEEEKKGENRTEELQRLQTEASKHAEKVWEEVRGNIDEILGNLENWIEIDNMITANAAKRLGYEQEMFALNKYAPNLGFVKVAERKYEIAQDNLEVMKMSYALMEKENKEGQSEYQLAAGILGYDKYSKEKMAQAKAAIDIAAYKAEAGKGTSEAQYMLDQRRAGKGTTIQDLYAAKVADVAEGKWYDRDYALIMDEKELAYLDHANKLLAGMGQSSEQMQAAFDEAFTALALSEGAMDKWKSLMKDKGWDKFMSLTGDENHMLKLAQMSFGTKEEKALPNKIKATKLALEHIKIEQDNIGKHKILIGLRKKMADIDMNTQKGWVALEEKRLATAIALNQMRAEVNRLQLEHDLKWIKDTLKAVSDSFKTAISDAFSDITSGVKEGKWDRFRTTMSEGLRNQAASSVGGYAQNAVFGNKGFLAGLLENTKYAHLVDDLFPKTQLELARESLVELQKHSDDLGELVLLQRGASIGLNPSQDIIGDLAKKGGDKTLDFLIYWGSKAFGLANGGYAPGGFRAFANGGIANRPTLGMIGEGNYNEAVVPLPDGKSIPVKGGANNNVTVNVAIDSNGQAKATESTGNGAKELGYMISQAVQSELVDQQRPGGLLSSYG